MRRIYADKITNFNAALTEEKSDLRIVLQNDH